jgi:N-acetyl-anhydromuramyl-L-alanine amidase AmpD
MSETDFWPFVQARHFKKVGASVGRKVRVIVIHDMEAPETQNTAENVARYFNTTTTVASAHICVDNNSIVQCVYDSDVAYAAPGCNHDGIQVELAGYGKQTRAEWMDFYGIALLALASDAVAQYCIKYGIPAVQLTNAELKAGKKGIVGHYQVSKVYKKSDHTDPGPGFPWDYFIESVRNFIAARKAA